MTVGTFVTGRAGLTFSFWFRFNNDANYAEVFDFGNGASNDNFHFKVYSNALTLFMWVGNNYKYFQLDGIYRDNVLRHFVWVFDPTGTCTAFVNGDIKQQVLSFYYPSSISRSSNYLGRSNWNGAPYFNGAIGDFRLYDRMLSATEIKTLYFLNQIVSLNFAYTGSEQFFKVPSDICIIQVNVTGAGGGTDLVASNIFPGGFGGSVVSDLSVASGTTLCVVVGMLLNCNLSSITIINYFPVCYRQGSMGSSRNATTRYVVSRGGFNGGGNSGQILGGGGGGASDIRTACSNYSTVLVVAGGGGGGLGPAVCYSNGI
jgi:hypothetical protein